MKSPVAKAGLVAVAIGLAVVLFLLLGNGSDGEPGAEQPVKPEKTQVDKPPKSETPQVAVIEVEGGEPVGGVRELEFAAGEEIRFTVRSDVGDEVHLHGYDVSEPVAAGGEARFEVAATIEGVFEVELEQRAVPVAEIAVNP